MATMLDRVPVAKITGQAREVHFWRTVLTVIAGLLFGLGWLVAKVVAVAWLALAWVFVAVREGYREGRKTATPPS
jgi:uncharacterized membrane protein YedE/YeeE